MFHYKDNIFFGRKADGSVRIVAFNKPPATWPNVDTVYDVEAYARFDVTIDPDSWASIVSTVSLGNEIDGRFYSARKFHESTGPIEIRPSRNPDGPSLRVAEVHNG